MITPKQVLINAIKFKSVDLRRLAHEVRNLWNGKTLKDSDDLPRLYHHLEAEGYHKTLISRLAEGAVLEAILDSYIESQKF